MQRFAFRWTASRLMICAVGAIAAAGGVQAQDISALKARTAVSDDDRNQLRTWISQQMQQLSGDSAAGADLAATALRELVDGATPAFREAYVVVLSEAVRQGLPAMPPAPAARALSLLGALGEPSTSALLIDTLADERPAVRTAAVIGLRNLRGKLASVGGAAATNVMNALRDAGKRESAPLTLQAIYEALDFPAASSSPPDARSNLSAVLELLELRSQLYEAGTVDHLAPELAGLRTINSFRRSLNDDDKKRLASVLGRMLRHAVREYQGGLYRVRDSDANPRLVQLRNSTEVLISEIESLLPVTLPSGGERASIIDALKGVKDPADRFKLTVEMNKWADQLERATGQRFHLEEGGEAAPASPNP